MLIMHLNLNTKFHQKYLFGLYKIYSLKSTCRCPNCFQMYLNFPIPESNIYFKNDILAIFQVLDSHLSGYCINVGTANPVSATWLLLNLNQIKRSYPIQQQLLLHHPPGAQIMARIFCPTTNPYLNCQYFSDGHSLSSSSQD